MFLGVSQRSCSMSESRGSVDLKGNGIVVLVQEEEVGTVFFFLPCFHCFSFL